MVLPIILVTATGGKRGSSFQQVIVDGKAFLRRRDPSPSTLNECTCSVAGRCPNSSISVSSFYCTHGRNCSQGTVVWAIPGIVTECTDLGTVMLSDLRCLFDQTCVDTFLSMYNLDLPSRLPLSERTRSIKALNGSSLTLSRTTDTVESLAYRLMIEKWSLEPDFDSYFSHCVPMTCSYSIRQPLDLVFIVQTVISYFGLTVALRLIVPMLTWLLHEICDMSCRSGNVRRRDFRFRETFARALFQANLFKQERRLSRLPNAERVAIISTRLYVLCLSTSIIVLLFFAGFRQQVNMRHVDVPSISVYETLQSLHSDRLTCPCRQIAVPYSKMISLTPKMNQVSQRAFILLDDHRRFFFARYVRVISSETDGSVCSTGTAPGRMVTDNHTDRC